MVLLVDGDNGEPALLKQVRTEDTTMPDDGWAFLGAVGDALRPLTWSSIAATGCASSCCNSSSRDRTGSSCARTGPRGGSVVRLPVAEVLRLGHASTVITRGWVRREPLGANGAMEAVPVPVVGPWSVSRHRCAHPPMSMSSPAPYPANLDAAAA